MMNAHELRDLASRMLDMLERVELVRREGGAKHHCPLKVGRSVWRSCERVGRLRIGAVLPPFRRSIRLRYSLPDVWPSVCDARTASIIKRLHGGRVRLQTLDRWRVSMIRCPPGPL